ncbi:MAG: phytanoyl-CoA dioxygenase family protein [Actinomyces sp.]|nr:MAG: phytanoyl-CoA dioxygenase family protein [Actinomyces sp.]
MDIPADIRDRVERDGFAVLADFVPAERCDELRAHTENLLAGVDPDVDGALTVFSTTEQTHTQDEWFLTSGDTIRWFLEDGAVDEQGRLTRPLPLAVNKLGHAMHDLDPVFDRFSRTPELAALADELGFVDPRLLQSMYIFKQPGIGGEVVCHCDHTFLWTEPPSVMGFWFALEDATVDNGCLWAIPGGHRIPVKTRFRRRGRGTVTEVLDPTPYPTEELVPLEVAKGTLVVLHGTLPHWSGPNRSERSRHAYTLHVIEGTAHYPDDNWLQRRPDLPLRGFRTSPPATV